MRLHAIPWLVAVVAVCGLQVASHAADVTIKLEGTDRHVTTPAYEAVVADDGSLTSLRVGGLELVNGAGTRGIYYYQDGVPKMPKIEQPAADVIVASGEKASVRFEFGADTITCTLANLTAKGMEYVIVFDPAVAAVMSDKGEFAKTSVNCNWDASTWFRDKAKLRVASTNTKLWGPFGNNCQVWTTALGANETRKMTLMAGTASKDEMAKAARAKPLGPVPPPPPAATPDPDAKRFKGTNYEAFVGADGSLTNLRVAGTEMLTSNASFPRGVYLFQGGLVKLPNIEMTGDNVLTAKSEKGSVRYEFTPEGINCTLTNATAQGMEWVLVFEEPVNAVMDDKGRYFKAPIERMWETSTWFQGKARVKITGGTRIWGPWNGNHAIWSGGVAPNATRAVKFEIGLTTAAEAAKAAEAVARGSIVPKGPVGPMWDMKVLGQAPKVYPAEGFKSEGCKAIYYEGRPFEERPTRVFAWVGLPKMEPGKKVPGIVLVHGGGGTAFDTWVKLWTSRGYAAIAMDTCGCVPKGVYGAWERAEMGGPPGWGGFGQIDDPREDQWTYHAVADAILANSLLRSMPEVDPNRIGLTGISWGGYLTCIIAGADNRFRFAAPVYGCGYTLDMTFAPSVLALGKERGDRWMRWWDPSSYLGNAKMPMLWVTGSNDFAYTFNALQKSYRLPTGPWTLAIRLRMPHGHGPAGEGPEEIHAFADSILMGGEPLVKITGQGRDGNNVWATFTGKTPLAKAELNVTKDRGNWPDRKWDALPATIEGGKVTGVLPEGTTTWYLNLFDTRDLVVSTEHEEMR